MVSHHVCAEFDRRGPLLLHLTEMDLEELEVRGPQQQLVMHNIGLLQKQPQQQQQQAHSPIKRGSSLAEIEKELLDEA